MDFPLHPYVVHFSVGLILTGVVLFLVEAAFRGRAWGPSVLAAARWNLWIGAACALASIGTGFVDYIGNACDEAAIRATVLHRRSGAVTWWSSLIVGIALYRTRHRPPGRRLLTGLVFVGLAATVAAVLGTRLTYDRGLGVDGAWPAGAPRCFEAERRPVPPREARLDDTAAVALPAPASPEFCRAVQQVLASTTLTGENTLFTDMPEYRHSKPAANPHRIYQVVTYAGRVPIVVSCKVKTAAHLRAVYGPAAAGADVGCAEITRRTRDGVVGKLRAAGQDAAAARAAAFVVEDNEPYLTGRDYLADFQPAFVADDGALHLASYGLFQDYDSWITPFLPWQVQGQHYCHLPTADFVEALATGAMAPGRVVTTADDAPVTPR